jgi:hypothetical protein
MSSQLRPLSPEKLANSAVLAAGLSLASGSACGFIQSTGAAFGGLIGAAVSDLSEKHLAGRPAVWIFQGESVVPPVCGAAEFVGLFRILCGLWRGSAGRHRGQRFAGISDFVGYVHLLGNGKSPTLATESG